MISRLVKNLLLSCGWVDTFMKSSHLAEGVRVEMRLKQSFYCAQYPKTAYFEFSSQRRSQVTLKYDISANATESLLIGQNPLKHFV